jgi:elongation factor Ts
VALESSGDQEKLRAFGAKVAMHVAAAKPVAIRREDVSAEMLERERAVLSEQAKASGKPAEIIGKMVEGRLRQYYEEVVLLEQVYVHDQDLRVKQAVEKAAKELGAPIKVTGFMRFALGEGIDKEQADAA